jgi:hypothetical protein
MEQTKNWQDKERAYVRTNLPITEKKAAVRAEVDRVADAVVEAKPLDAAEIRRRLLIVEIELLRRRLENSKK